MSTEDLVREMKCLLGPSTYEVGFGLKEPSDITKMIVNTESDYFNAASIAGALSTRQLGRFDLARTASNLAEYWAQTWELVVTDESHRAIMRAALALFDDLEARPGVVDGPRLVGAIDEALAEPAPDPERPSMLLLDLLNKCLKPGQVEWMKAALHEAAHAYVAHRVGFIPFRVEMFQ
jgi:hypothetical protein